MIPIRDHAPERTIVPFLTWLLIAANIGVFLLQFRLQWQSPHLAAALIDTYGMVPARVLSALTLEGSLVGGFLPILTSMFMHGGWMHLIGNVWFLWIFGDNVEDALGHVGFLMVYFGGGILAAISQFAADPFTTIPMVGASGAISAVMGAYLVGFPRAQITVLVPLLIFFTSLRIPAFVMLPLWFGLQFLNGTSGGGGGVAWWAHIGGFAAGLALMPLISRRHRQRHWRRY